MQSPHNADILRALETLATVNPTKELDVYGDRGRGAAISNCGSIEIGPHEIMRWSWVLYCPMPPGEVVVISCGAGRQCSSIFRQEGSA